MSNVDVVQAEKPPLIVLNVAIFTLTALVTLIAVPWYGIEHGYSAGIWAFAGVLPGRQRNVHHRRLSPAVGAQGL